MEEAERHVTYGRVKNPDNYKRMLVRKCMLGNQMLTVYATIRTQKALKDYLTALRNKAHKKLAKLLKPTQFVVAASMAEKKIDSVLRVLKLNERGWFDSMRNTMTERELSIFAMRVNGFTYQKIGDVFGLSRQRIDQILGKISKKQSHHGNS